MANQIKENIVTELAKELKETKHVVVTQYQGMTAEGFDALRKALTPLGGKYKVVKNRLAKIAFDQSGFDDLKDQMKGPSAIVYSGSDGAAITKALFKFTESNDKFRVRGGKILGLVTDSNGLRTISNLPSKEVLMSTLLARMQSPLISLVQIMNEPLSKLQRALSALAKTKAA
ncbi:MAG: 50S ribosomal protein L10 [Elusimicrobiota bacterium]